jgi:small subunit ribosomal protein S16
MRLGKMRSPYYRIVVADSRTKRDGRAIEEIGKYHPKQEPSFIEVNSERAAYWLGVGAQPTEAVAAILRVTGDWQKFKGEAAPPPMKIAAEKTDKKAVFEAAAKEAAGEPAAEATTPKKRATTKAAEEPTEQSSEQSGRSGHPADPERAAGEASAEDTPAAPSPQTSEAGARSQAEGERAEGDESASGSPATAGDEGKA